jgi:metal-responsive CopG/Arc/MetJ family transcriptional regulator
MKRTTVFLEEDLQRELKIVAQYKGVPAASVLRDAIDEYLRAERKRRPRALSIMAIGRSSRRDTAERHEELLWKDLSPHGGSPKPRKTRHPR